MKGLYIHFFAGEISLRAFLLERHLTAKGDVNHVTLIAQFTLTQTFDSFPELVSWRWCFFLPCASFPHRGRLHLWSRVVFGHRVATIDKLRRVARPTPSHRISHLCVAKGRDKRLCYWCGVSDKLQACIKSSKIKGFGDGKKIKSLRKKSFLEDLILFVVPKGKIWFLHYNLTQSKPKHILFHCFVRKKIIDFVMQRVASWGRK